MQPARRDLGAALLCGAATLVGLLLAFRHGIVCSPDGWAYWGSSVMLLHGHGYLDWHGLPVQQWPPLYPLWLAGWQAALGVSGRSVAVATAAAGALGAGLLCRWALARVPAQGPRWPVAVYCAAWTTGLVRAVQAESLMLPLLAGMLLCADAARRARGSAAHWLLVLAMALCALLGAAVRNASLPLGLAGAVLLLADRGRPVARRALAAGALTAICGGGWLALRLWLGQGDSHVVGLDAGSLPAGELAWQFLRGLDRGVAPFPLGMLTLALALLALGPLAARARRGLGLPPPQPRHGDVVAFVLLALAGLYGLFLVTRIADPPRERFVGPAAAVVVALAVAVARSVPRPAWRWALLAVLLAQPVARAVRYAVVGRGDPGTPVTTTGGASFVLPGDTLHPDLRSETLLADGRRVVVPPLFEWQAVRLQRGEGRR